MNTKELVLLSIVLFVLIAGFIVGCGKDPVPPGPKVTTFTVGNANIQVQGEVLPGSKVSVEEAKAVVNLAIEMLEAE